MLQNITASGVTQDTIMYLKDCFVKKREVRLLIILYICVLLSVMKLSTQFCLWIFDGDEESIFVIL